MTAPLPVEVPHAPESEKACLGAILNEGPTCFPLALAEYQLHERDFHIPAHALIFMAMRAVYEKHPSTIDAMLVTDKLRNMGHLEEVGGLSYLMHLLENSPISAFARTHFEQVKNFSLIRSGIQVAKNIVAEGYQAQDGRSFLMQAPSMFYEQIPRRKDERTLDERMAKPLNFWREISLLPPGTARPIHGLSTGIWELDQLCSGLQPGLNLLAGRPSAGKTSLEGTISMYSAKQGIPVARIANDMSLDMVLIRDMCREAGVSLSKLNKGFADKGDLEKIEAAKRDIPTWPMHIESNMHDIREICTWARLMKSRHDIKLLTIDYIQQCTAPYLGQKRSEYEEVTEVARVLKMLSFELEIPVLALAQFNREGEQGKRKPQLSDLRGSGTLEQEASLCMFVYKALDYEYSNRGGDFENKRRAVVLEMAKQQNGETGVIPMWFHCPYFMLEAAEPNWGRDFQ